MFSRLRRAGQAALHPRHIFLRPVLRNQSDTTILLVDDPWWDSHYPPNGWNCRCTVQQMSETMIRQAIRDGEKITRTAPDVVQTPRNIRKDDGSIKTIEVPEGIDTGFGYNVGKAAWGAKQQQGLIEKFGGDFPDLESPAKVETRKTDLDVVPAPAILGVRIRSNAKEALPEEFRRVMGGDEKIVTDPTGHAIALTQGIVDHMLEKPESRVDGREQFFSVIPKLIEDPQEIWVGFAVGPDGKVHMRRRYAGFYQFEKDRVVGFVSDAVKGNWVGLTFFRGKPDTLNRLRTGMLVYKKRGL